LASGASRARLADGSPGARGATATTASANSTQRTAGRLAGNATIQAAVPRKFTIAIGTRYFQHISIIWSTRTRGSVQRNQMASRTKAYDFAKKTANWSALRSTGCCSSAHGICQPPRNSVVVMAPMT
jgi:hypothetical protein